MRFPYLALSEMCTSLYIQGTVIGWSLNTVGVMTVHWQSFRWLSVERLNKWTIMLIAVASDDKERSLGQPLVA